MAWITRMWCESFQFGINVGDRSLRKRSHLCQIWFRAYCSPRDPRWCRRGQVGFLRAKTPSVLQSFPGFQEAPHRSCRSPVPLLSPQTAVVSSNTSRSANSSSKSQRFCITKINSCFLFYETGPNFLSIKVAIRSFGSSNWVFLSIKRHITLFEGPTILCQMLG